MKTTDDPKRTRVNARLNASDHARLMAFAQSLDCSLTDAVRYLVRRFAATSSAAHEQPDQSANLASAGDAGSAAVLDHPA